ncbi:hypothetical protein HYU11_00610 [Candidatus Woesearchaeota archaeon]|nr:hypothetical protein [Candidatus Woesearchaeota archaeon]
MGQRKPQDLRIFPEGVIESTEAMNIMMKTKSKAKPQLNGIVINGLSENGLKVKIVTIRNPRMLNSMKVLGSGILFIVLR